MGPIGENLALFKLAWSGVKNRNFRVFLQPRGTLERPLLSPEDTVCTKLCKVTMSFVGEYAHAVRYTTGAILRTSIVRLWYHS